MELLWTGLSRILLIAAFVLWIVRFFQVRKKRSTRGLWIVLILGVLLFLTLITLPVTYSTSIDGTAVYVLLGLLGVGMIVATLAVAKGAPVITPKPSADDPVKPKLPVDDATKQKPPFDDSTKRKPPVGEPPVIDGKWICPACEAQNAAEDVQCVLCGYVRKHAPAAPKKRTRVCMLCQNSIDADLAVCPYCGTKQE